MVNNIAVVDHTLNSIYLTWSDCVNCKKYNIEIYDMYKRLVIKDVTTDLNYCKTFSFQTGHYTIKINGNTIHSVIPPICRLSSGGCGTLISGANFGINKPVILTANHCLPNDEIAKQTLACFECFNVTLRPDLFWCSSSSCKQGGIDYSVIGISDNDIISLQKHRIYPQNTSTYAFANDNIALLHYFKFNTANQKLKTVCHIKSKLGNSIKYTYDESFGKSAVGSSGSSLYGFDENMNLTVQGLHVAHGKSIQIGAILFDIKNKMIKC